MAKPAAEAETGCIEFVNPVTAAGTDGTEFVKVEGNAALPNSGAAATLPNGGAEAALEKFCPVPQSDPNCPPWLPAVPEMKLVTGPLPNERGCV